MGIKKSLYANCIWFLLVLSPQHTYRHTQFTAVFWEQDLRLGLVFRTRIPPQNLSLFLKPSSHFHITKWQKQQSAQAEVTSKFSPPQSDFYLPPFPSRSLGQQYIYSFPHLHFVPHSQLCNRLGWGLIMNQILRHPQVWPVDANTILELNSSL